MNASGNMLFGIGFHILMYGEGKKINRRYDTLSDYDEITLDGLQSRYYYIGDIDYEGIGIFNELTEQNPALQIKLMTPLYIMMLEKSKEVSLPFTKDMQVESNPESFLAEFEPQYRDMIVKILQSRRYIPQEILNYGDFIKIIEGSADV